MPDDLFLALKNTNKLPSPPGVALRILELARSDDAHLDDLAQVISSDPALASRILRFINSPVAGVTRGVSSLQEAVNQLGFRGVQLIALSFSLINSQTMAECPSFDLRRFWSRSLACAVSAKFLATSTRAQDPNQAFIIGLLNRIGQLALACSIPTRYEPILQSFISGSTDLITAEQTELGTDHLAISARLLQDWQLPESVWKPILQGRKTTQPDSGDSTPAPVNQILYVADLTASLLCDSLGTWAVKADEILTRVQADFEIEPAVWSGFFDQIVHEWTTFGQLLSVEAGTNKSFQNLQEEARDHLAQLTVATQLENQDIRVQNQQLLKRALIDPLTGIANRAALDERLQAELDRSQRSRQPLAFCLLDIDHFKQFNDRYGHQLGDQALQAVAKALEDSSRKMDLVARYGGEEFAVIAPECKTNAAQALAERLRAAVEEIELIHNGQTLPITISVGLAFALWPYHPKSGTDLIAAADTLLYQAKDAGRNCCRVEPLLIPASQAEAA